MRIERGDWVANRSRFSGGNIKPWNKWIRKKEEEKKTLTPNSHNPLHQNYQYNLFELIERWWRYSLNKTPFFLEFVRFWSVEALKIIFFLFDWKKKENFHCSILVIGLTMMAQTACDMHRTLFPFFFLSFGRANSSGNNRENEGAELPNRYDNRQGKVHFSFESKRAKEQQHANVNNRKKKKKRRVPVYMPTSSFFCCE